MPPFKSPTVLEFFNGDRPKGDFVCRFNDFEIPLADGSVLKGLISNYIVVQRLAVAYFELYLPVEDANRAAGIISGLLQPILENPQFLLPEPMKNFEIRNPRNDQDVPMRLNQLPVMPRFTIYAAARISLEVKKVLVSRWESNGLELTINDQNYVDTHERELKPYAFISHDSRDKEGVARPLAERLRVEVGTVWYDEFSLEVGDSLRESIEAGIRRSDHCVIILSKAFLENTGWAKREFDSIYTKEIVEKQKVILPVWVDVTPDELYQYSMILAERAGLHWSDGIDAVSASLAKKLKKPSS